jgi:sugar O-acyltransferase (sialic acid O-acetyltransferase NeuD family)
MFANTKLRVLSVKKKVMIFGTGGHAVSAASLAEQCGFSVCCFVSLQETFGEINGKQIRSIHSFPSKSRIAVVIAVGDNFLRENLAEELNMLAKRKSIEITFPNLIHPTCHIGSHTKFGQGNQLFPGANLGAHSRIEDFVILNHLSSLDHESCMDSFASLAPGAVTGGRVKIGRRSALLINSAISNGISIGSDVVIAANSFVKEDVIDNSLVAGSPAKFIRHQRAGDSYL